MMNKDILLYQDNLICQLSCKKNQGILLTYMAMIAANFFYLLQLVKHALIYLLLLLLIQQGASHCFVCFANEVAVSSESNINEDDTQNIKRIHWVSLEPGLEFYEFRPEESGARITVLRIDPRDFEFVLKSSGEDHRGLRSLDQWAKEYQLIAAINASMYLPDNKTSTGYMRQKDYVNNPRIVERFGAFFVAQPRKPDIPQARIVDKDDKNWQEILDDYDLVIQNYRMTNSKRRILWSPGGPLYAISAIAQDGEGRILFLHSSVPMEAYNFVQQILHLPLDARTIMYVEGGAQAGLLLHSAGIRRDLGAPHAPSLLITGNLKAILPNILGIRAKSKIKPIH